MAAVIVSSITLIQPTETVKADDIVTYDVPSYSTREGLNSVAPQVSYEFQTSTEAEEYVVAIKVKEDSLLYVSSKRADDAFNPAACGTQVYTDRACGNKVFQGDLTDVSANGYAFVKAGTYYLRLFTDGKTSYGVTNPSKVEASFAAMPTKDVLTYKVKVDKTKTSATITFKNNIGMDILKGVKVANYGINISDFTSSCWTTGSEGITDLVFDDDNTATYTYKANGTYTFRLYIGKLHSWSAETGTSYTVKLDGIDDTKPTVSGVKNNKTYTKSVTIKATDKDSGLKSATLNGKTIKVSKLKSGYKVSKAGSYTLKVKDKAGNTKTVKFKIKKK
jgi:hypothetical protein